MEFQTINKQSQLINKLDMRTALKTNMFTMRQNISYIEVESLVPIVNICEFALRISILEFAYTCVSTNFRKRKKG